MQLLCTIQATVNKLFNNNNNYHHRADSLQAAAAGL